MFTATNVAATSASAGGVGPVATAVPAPFQIISSTSVNGSSGSSSSSSSLSSSSISTSSSTTTGQSTWRFTPLNSSIIKQPSVVSIRNGSTGLTTPLNSTGLTFPGNTSIIRIQTANSIQYHPTVTTNPMTTTTTTGNLIIQTPQSVRLVSAPLHTSSSAPTLTRLNNSNMTINSNVRQIITPATGQKTIFSPKIEIFQRKFSFSFQQFLHQHRQQISKQDFALIHPFWVGLLPSHCNSRVKN